MKRWRLGSLLGFPIDIGLGFLLLLGFVAIWRGGLLGVGMVLLAFGSVLLHELGHAVVARRLKVRVDSIELGFFGGAAKMVTLPSSASHEIAIAAAGPAVSVVLAGLGLGIGAATGVELIELIGWINVVIAAFNLIPALPMDGGRILRALLTWKWSYVRATDLAVMLSRGFAVLLVVAAIAWGQWTLALMAVFLWMLGTRERAIARMVASQYRTGAGGYVERRWDDPVVMPRGAYPGPGAASVGGFGTGFGTEPGDAGGRGAWPRGITIRQVGGRLVVELHR
jgi:Zn-dependent protease